MEHVYVAKAHTRSALSWTEKLFTAKDVLSYWPLLFDP
jgi:hypothetical protein